jgi:ribosome-binding factor A
MSATRLQKLAKLIKEELSLIIRREMNDPRLGMISITDVEVSPDLHTARIYISAYGTAEEQDASITALKSAARFLRGKLGNAIEVRHTPELSFELDLSLERGSRVVALLKDLHVPEAPTTAPAPADATPPDTAESTADAVSGDAAEELPDDTTDR